MKRQSTLSDRPTGSHRAAPRRSGRVRAGLAMCAVAAVGAGLGAQGTFAFWTDSGTANTGSFVSGTLDITLNGALAGNGGATALSFSANALLPGESVAFSFPVRNNGSTPLSYSLAATGSGGLAVTNGLQYSVTFGQTAVNTGSADQGTRAGACGTAATDANTTLLTGTATNFVTAAAPRSLAVNASETACLVVRLNSSAPNALQNLSGAASFVFSAKQPGV